MKIEQHISKTSSRRILVELDEYLGKRMFKLAEQEYNDKQQAWFFTKKVISMNLGQFLDLKDFVERNEEDILSFLRN